jgi:hypothetical protein
MNNIELPYHLIRRNLKEVIENDVSRNYVNCVKGFLEEILEKIAISTILTLEYDNKLRSMANLPEVRRVDYSLFVKVKENLLNQIFDDFNGEIGNCKPMQTTILSKANVEVV